MFIFCPYTRRILIYLFIFLKVKPSFEFDVFPLLWGKLGSHLSHLRQSFDVIIGSELMYYKTDVAMLSDIITEVLRPGGIFLHIHCFRVDGLDHELKTAMQAIGLETLICKPEDILSAEDQDMHPEWMKVTCLMSAPPEVADTLLDQHSFLKHFCPNIVDDDDYADESDSDPEPEIKMSIDELMSKYNVKL